MPKYIDMAAETPQFYSAKEQAALTFNLLSNGLVNMDEGRFLTEVLPAIKNQFGRIDLKAIQEVLTAIRSNIYLVAVPMDFVRKNFGNNVHAINPNVDPQVDASNVSKALMPFGLFITSQGQTSAELALERALSTTPEENKKRLERTGILYLVTLQSSIQPYTPNSSNLN
ncbi:MAG: hypothetical protein AAB874_01810 [Patescibacteria group bacterium]